MTKFGQFCTLPELLLKLTFYGTFQPCQLAFPTIEKLSPLFFYFPRQLYSDNMQYAFVQKDIFKTTKLAIFPLKTQKPHNLIEYLGSFILLLF